MFQTLLPPIYVNVVQKMSLVRLSFRKPPMRIKIRKPIDIESPPLPKLPKEPSEPKEFKEPKLPMSNKIMYCIIFVIMILQ